jgi:malonyl-CoA O-methyltransferase
MTDNQSNQSFQLDKQLIAEHFSQAASTYDAHAQLQVIIGDRLFERLDYMAIEPRVVIDLGCGTGRYTEQLQQRYTKAKVTGIDIAPKMIEFAKKRKKWLAKQKYVCQDAEQLPFADQSVDLVFSNLMIQWLENPDALFAECRRVLKPGGLLLFSSFGPDTLKEMRAAWQSVDDHVHVNRFMDMHDVGDSLQKQRYFGVVMDAEQLTMTYPSVKAIHQDLKGIGAININQGRRHGLMGKQRYQAYLKAYQQFKREQDQQFPATWEVVYGHAWRPTATDNTTPKGPTTGMFNPGERIGVKTSND